MSDSQNPSTSTPTGAPASEHLYLEDILVALQKSFSRVSSASGNVNPDAPLALITGPVGFEITVRVAPERDRLLHKADGDVQLKLSGTVRPDIRMRHLDDAKQ
jgi:hypothetical protein